MSFDIRDWLTRIGLPQYAELFLEQGFDHEGIASLTDAKLQELGVKAMGHRMIIEREAHKLREEGSPAPSQPPAAAPKPESPVARGVKQLLYRSIFPVSLG